MLEKIDPLRDFVEVNLQVDAPPETALTDEQLDKLGELLMPGGGGLGRERVGEFFDPEPVGVCRGICM